IGVIGFGVVGSAVAKALRRYEPRDIRVFDASHAACDGAVKGGFRVEHSIQALFDKCDLVIGATGQMLDVAPRNIAAPTVIASASSWNYEFWKLMQGSRRLRRPTP